MTKEREQAFSAIRDAIATGIKRFLAAFRHVNPPVVMERLRRELQEANEAYTRSLLWS